MLLRAGPWRPITTGQSRSRTTNYKFLTPINHQRSLQRSFSRQKNFSDSKSMDAISKGNVLKTTALVGLGVLGYVCYRKFHSSSSHSYQGILDFVKDPNWTEMTAIKLHGVLAEHHQGFKTVPANIFDTWGELFKGNPNDPEYLLQSFRKKMQGDERAQRALADVMAVFEVTEEQFWKELVEKTNNRNQQSTVGQALPEFLQVLKYKAFEQEVVDYIKKQNLQDVFKSAELFEKLMKQKIQKELPQLQEVWNRRIVSSIKVMVISAFIADQNLVDNLIKSPPDIDLSYESLMYILEQLEAWRNTTNKVENAFTFITNAAEKDQQLSQQKMKVLKAMLQDLKPVLAPV